MLKRLFVFVGALAALLAPTHVAAAPYSSGIYGACRFSEGCAPPVESEPEPEPSTPQSVNREIDGVSVTATDQNEDAADGYESFSSANNAATELAAVDGDGDGKTDFILNMDGDEFPERYWDPDDNLISTVQLADCDGDDTPEWRFDVGPEIRTYDPDTNTFLESCEAPSDPNSNPGSTGSIGNRGNNGPGKDNRITRILPLISNNPVYQSVGEVIKKVPEPIAYSFPYLLLFLILFLVIRLVVQSRQEVNRLLVATRTQEAEKQLGLEKANFMMLSSHYLRTPITVINGNIELMTSLKQITDEVGKTLNSAGKLLLAQVSSLLERLEQDKKLAAIQVSSQQTRMTTFISPRLVLPVILIVTTILLGQFLFIDFKVVSPSIINILVQILLVVLLVQAFLANLRKRQLNKHNRLDQERLLNEQRTLDSARSEFITSVADNLEVQLNQFRQQLGDVISKPEASKVKRALEELAGMVAKFRLVAFLQGQKLEASKAQFGLRELVDESLATYNQPAAIRGITLDENIEDGQLFQQKLLLGIILKSLVDNAMKYSDDGTVIEISAKNDQGRSMLRVRDQGKGISKDKQEFLFKPFSRVESVETFDTEGLGFSLYLDKMIANYLQGDISVESDIGKGTTVVVTVPSSA